MPSEQRRYRILYHHRTQALDGQRVHIREIQDALRRQGHDVLEAAPLAASESAGATATPSVKRRVLSTIARLTPAGGYELLEFGYNLPAYLGLLRTIRQFKPDFIYERYSANTTAGIWAARTHGIPCLLEVNSPLADEKRATRKLMFYGATRRTERYVLTNASLVLAVTEVLKRTLIAASGVAEERVKVIQNGVDIQRFERAGRQRQEIRARFGVGSEVVIGAVGFFREWHGIDLLLKAVKREPVLWRNARVLLVGEGPVVPALKALAQQLGMEERVLFLGPVPHEEVPELTAAMDVTLIPRAVEYASPLKLFEYMASQKAIVAPRQPNLEEIVTDGSDALLFEPENESELTAALVKVVGDAPLRQQLGRAARQTIDRKHLTWDSNAAAIVRAFEETRDRAARPRSADVRARRVVSLTTVFPNVVQPTHGVFVYERLRHLARIASLRVVAPFYWTVRGSRSLPRYEEREGIDVHHPRIYYLPGVLKFMDGCFLFLSVLPTFRRLRRTFDFDMIDAHFAFPEGFAAALLSIWFNRPFTITMRGTEIPLSRYRLRRRAIRWALRRAARVIAVAEPLAQYARSAGVPPSRVAVVTNGVDALTFTPRPRTSARTAVGVGTDGRLLVSVGHLSARKGFQRVIRILPRLLEAHRDVIFAIIGGPGGEPSNKPELEALVRKLGLDNRVMFVGAEPPDRVADWLNAADLFVLASDYEGCPNVVLEALACGRPVVATSVGHVEHMVPAYGGVLVDDPEDETTLLRAIDEALIRPWDPEAIARYGQRQSWSDVAVRVSEEWRLAIGHESPAGSPHPDQRHTQSERLDPAHRVSER